MKLLRIGYEEPCPHRVLFCVPLEIPNCVPIGQLIRYSFYPFLFVPFFEKGGQVYYNTLCVLFCYLGRNTNKLETTAGGKWSTPVRFFQKRMENSFGSWFFYLLKKRFNHPCLTGGKSGSVFSACTDSGFVWVGCSSVCLDASSWS